MSVIGSQPAMKNMWIGRNIEEFSSRGVVFFHSKYEFPEALPCKLYRIDQTHGNLHEHTHDYFQIWYVVKGGFMHSYFGRRHKMLAGSVCIVPPFAVHGVEWIAGRQTEVIGCEFLPNYINERFTQPVLQSNFMDYQYLHPVLSEGGRKPSVMSLSGEEERHVRTILEEMQREFRMKTPHYGLVLKANLLRLLVLLSRGSEDHDTRTVVQVKKEGDRINKHREAVQVSLDYVHKHFHEDIRLEQICRLASLSKTYFCDVFKSYTGKSFNEYLNDFRMRQASEMLLTRDTTVAEVCRAVGFRDLTHFSRMFKRWTGIPPSHYRKKSR